MRLLAPDSFSSDIIRNPSLCLKVALMASLLTSPLAAGGPQTSSTDELLEAGQTPSAARQLASQEGGSLTPSVPSHVAQSEETAQAPEQLPQPITESPGEFTNVASGAEFPSPLEKFRAEGELPLVQAAATCRMDKMELSWPWSRLVRFLVFSYIYLAVASLVMSNFDLADH